MIRIRALRCLIDAATVALAVGLLLPEPVCAQTSDPLQARDRPLYIIDGVVLHGGTATDQEAVLKLIRPAVESIEVLKGAAAVERFGAAADNGAVIIRLKREFARGRPGATEGARRDDVVPAAPFDALLPAPLVLIDGVEVSRTVIGVLAPQDIERIEVLKGAAAAAQFGERGSAGVVHITMRRRQLP